jgi:hypothetical protein
MTITTVDNGDGNIGIRCEVSGLPLTRANDLGMFCDAQPCACEEGSKAVFPVLKEICDLLCGGGGAS